MAVKDFPVFLFCGPQILPHRQPRGELFRELTHRFLRISMAVYTAEVDHVVRTKPPRQYN